MENEWVDLGVDPSYSAAPAPATIPTPNQEWTDLGVDIAYDPKKYGMGAVYEARNAPDIEFPEPVRHGIRTGARLAEGVASGVSALPQVAGAVVDYATGKNISKYIPDLGEKLRTYVTKPLLGKSQEPQGDWEKSIDEGVNLFGQFIAPTGLLGLAGKGAKAATALTKGEKAVKVAKTVGKTAGLVGASKAADWGLEYFDVPKKYHTPVKLATLLGTGWLMNSGAVTKVKGSYYDEAKDALKEHTVRGTDLPDFTVALKDLPDAHFKKLSQAAQKTANKLTSGAKTSTNDVIKLQKELNQLRYGKASIGMTHEAGAEVGNVAGRLAGDLENYAKKTKIESVKDGIDRFLTAEQIHQAENMNEAIGETVGKALSSDSGSKLISNLKNIGELTALFKVPGMYLPYKAVKTAGKLAVSSVTGSIDFANKIQKYPKLKKAYIRVAKEGAKGEVGAAMLNSLKNLDSLLIK